MNTIPSNCERQEPAAFIKKFSLADFVDNNNVIDIAVPAGTVLVRGSVTVTDNSDAGTTDVLDVGDATTANRYKNDIDLKSAAMTALAPTGFTVTNAQPAIRLTRVPVGTAATGLEVMVEFEYLVIGHCDFTHD